MRGLCYERGGRGEREKGRKGEGEKGRRGEGREVKALSSAL
jgi:hypothetical protein